MLRRASVKNALAYNGSLMAAGSMLAAVTLLLVHSARAVPQHAKFQPAPEPSVVRRCVRTLCSVCPRTVPSQPPICSPDSGSPRSPRVCRRLQTSSSTARNISPGPAIAGNVAAAGEQEWFSFAATAGASYQIETDLQTLDDTMVDLIDTDGHSLLVENDDDDRNPNTYASYIEWTCPASGTYYIMVQGYGSSTGTFGLTLTQGGAGGGGAGSGDPCNGGITFQGGA